MDVDTIIGTARHATSRPRPVSLSREVTIDASLKKDSARIIMALNIKSMHQPSNRTLDTLRKNFEVTVCCIQNQGCLPQRLCSVSTDFSLGSIETFRKIHSAANREYFP